MHKLDIFFIQLMICKNKYSSLQMYDKCLKLKKEFNARNVFITDIMKFHAYTAL